MHLTPAVCLLLVIAPLSLALAFEPDQSPQPPAHPPLAPDDGEVATVNPPQMIWRVDDRAATYTVEFCQSPEFDAGVIRVEGIDMPFYNHSEVLEEGTWHWRYFVVDAEGESSEPSAVKSFVIAPGTAQMPVPPTDEIIANMPAHPRVFVTPDTLDEFRARRETVATEAWENLRRGVDAGLEKPLPTLDLQPMPEDPGTERKQVFYLKDGVPMAPAGFRNSDLLAAGSTANSLSLAWLISGDERYAERAKQWALFAAPFRMDYHLEDRGAHDTVVYNYEYGLKGMALAYDRLYHHLTEDERQAILEHLIYHCDNAYRWTHDALKLHLN